MAEREEAGDASAFGLVRVDGQDLIVPAARMRDVVSAPAKGALHPGVEQVKHQRRMDRNGRMEARRRLPRAEADASHELPLHAGRMQRHLAAIAGDDVASIDQAAHLHLEALDRRIDVAGRSRRGRLLAQNMPRLDRQA